MRHIGKFLFIGLVLTNNGASKNSYSQRIKPVLWGEGGKGIAYESFLKAHEKNNNQINFDVCNYMCDVVGGFYASVYSPEEKIEIPKCKDFINKSTGEIPSGLYKKYKDRYKNLFMFNLQFFLLDALTRYINKVSLVQPHNVELSLLEFFVASRRQTGNYFDNLFVPFRCVFSEVYKNKAVVFCNVQLPLEIHADTTYPLFFQPIEIMGVLCFEVGT